MQITVTISDELAAKVQARGHALESYVRELMEENLSREQAQDNQRRAAVEAMLKFAGGHGATLGGEELQGIVHEGHKR